MTEEDQSNSTLRRTFMKGAAATGVAATGITAFSGGAAAQQNIRQLNVRDINLQDGVLNLNVQNVNILRDFDEINVTVIGGDVLSNIDVNIENIDIDVNVEVVDVLNNNVVQVAILALSDGDIVAQGSGATNNLDLDELDT